MSQCLVRRENAVVSGGRISLVGSRSARIGVRDIDGSGMFLANIDSVVVMIFTRGVPSHNASFEVGRHVLVQERFASADRFAAFV